MGNKQDSNGGLIAKPVSLQGLMRVSSCTGFVTCVIILWRAVWCYDRDIIDSRASISRVVGAAPVKVRR